MSVCKLLLNSFPSCLFFLTTSLVLAQEAPAPCDPACLARIATAFASAEELEKAQRFEEAAQQYATVISEAPLATKAQEAAIRSGACLIQLAEYPEAIQSYDVAISIADRRQNDPNPSELTTLKKWKYDAMFRRAEALEPLGRFAEAAQDYAAVVAEQSPSPTK